MGPYFNRILFALIAAGNHFVPKRRQLVLHAFPDVEDQMVAILRWLQAHPKNSYRVSYLVSGDESEVRRKLRLLVGDYVFQIRIIKKTRVAAIWAYWRSTDVFFTHGLYGFMHPPKCQRVINLWHGMPLKRVWSGLPGSHVPQCTWLLSTSRMFSEVQATATGFPVEKVIASGLPRNDLLFSTTPAARAFRDKILDGADRVLMFLPTYRQSKMGFVTTDGQEAANALAMSTEELEQLKSWLSSSRTRILVKPHPMSVHYGRDERLTDQLWLISDAWLHEHGITLYEALGQMDALITDVSSVYVDFLALRRPVFFYFPDIAEYRRTRTFQIEPVEDWLAGPLCTSGRELNEALQQWISGADDYRRCRDEMAAELNPQCDRHATDRVFSLIGMEGGAASGPSQ